MNSICFQMWSVDYVQVPRDDKQSTLTEKSESMIVSSSPANNNNNTSDKMNTEAEATPSRSTDKQSSTKERVELLVKQMSLSTESERNGSNNGIPGSTESLLAGKSGSESSLSEEEPKSTTSTMNSTCKKESEAGIEEKEACSGDETEEETDLISEKVYIVFLLLLLEFR